MIGEYTWGIVMQIFGKEVSRSAFFLFTLLRTHICCHQECGAPDVSVWDCVLYRAVKGSEMQLAEFMSQVVLGIMKREKSSEAPLLDCSFTQNALSN